MRGLILSGGRGTRLRPLTYTSAKQLVPVANKPVLHYAIASLTAAGITDIAIVVGDTASEVQASVGDGSAFGASVTYVHQLEPLGLAHAVMTARDALADEPFVMYLGDNLIKDDLSPIIAEFEASDAASTVLLAHVPDAVRLGVADVANGRIIRVVEKPAHPTSDLAVVGVVLFRPVIFDAIERIEPSSRGELEITDAIQQLIDDGAVVTPHVISGWWKDTGRADDMLEANRIMLDALPDRAATPAGEGVRFEGKVYVGRDVLIRDSVIRGPVIIGDGVHIDDCYIGPYTALGDGCALISSEVENSIVLGETRIENLSHKVSNSLIGRGCTIVRATGRPHNHKFVIGDHSTIEVDD